MTRVRQRLHKTSGVGARGADQLESPVSFHEDGFEGERIGIAVRKVVEGMIRQRSAVSLRVQSEDCETRRVTLRMLLEFQHGLIKTVPANP